MPDDIRATDWFVIVCALGLGFGLMRLWLSSHIEQDERRTRRAKEGSDEAPAPHPDSEHWSSVLEVPAHAPLDDIRVAYRRKMAQYHPDKVAALGPELKLLAEQMSKRINQAFDRAIREKR